MKVKNFKDYNGLNHLLLSIHAVLLIIVFSGHFLTNF